MGIIIGGIIGLTALVCDSVNQYNQSHVSQLKTQRQLEIATDSLQKIELQGKIAQTTLDRIEHVVWRLEELKAHVSFEIPASDFDLTNLISEEEKKNFLLISAISANGIAFMISPQLIYDKGDPKIWNTNYENGSEILKVCRNPDGTFNTVSGENTRSGFNKVLPISLGLLEKSAAPNASVIPRRKSILQFLHSRSATINIWRADTKILDKKDFLANSEISTNVTVEYLFPSDRLRISCSFSFPNTNWTRTAKIRSLPDLADASIALGFGIYPPKNKSEIFPVYLWQI